MLAYQIKAGQNIAGLHQVNRALPEPSSYEVKVRIHAVSLNYRDLMVANGSYLRMGDTEIIPCSDGAGEVIAVGSQVNRFKIGDRVAASFFPEWIHSAPTPKNTASALGAAVDGVLAEEINIHQDGLVSVPDHLTFSEAATIPCAGVTAWNSLFEAGALRPGNSVLLLGTGGVSIWALQLAKSAGLFTIITSSSDEKLKRATNLGADKTINYIKTPEWQNEVLRMTDGRGVDLVLEVGGKGTLSKSIASTKMGGTIADIGGVSGFGGQIEPFSLIGGAKRMVGIFVGNRVMFESLNQFLAVSNIHPVIDRIFPFNQVHEAYQYLVNAGHFGKVVIQVRPN